LLAALAAAASTLFLACGSKPPPPPPPQVTFAQNIGYVEGMAAGCERALAEADQHFIAVMQGAAAIEPDPGVAVEPPGTMIATLQDKNINLSIELDEFSGAPIVRDPLSEALSVAPQSGKEKKQHKKLLKKNEKFGWMVGHLINQIEEVGGAYVLATSLSQGCNLKIPLAVSEMWQVKQQGTPQEQAQIRNATGRLLAVTKKADALAAATTGLLASYQAAVAGESAPVLNQVFAAIQQSMPIRIQVNKADIDAQIADVDMRYQQQSYLYQQYSATHGSAIVTPTAGQQPAGQLDAAAVEALQLLPQGSDFNDLAQGTRAVRQGDYQSALGAAATVAGRVLAATPLSQAFSAAASLVAAVEEL
jgi:hypothetical protein